MEFNIAEIHEAIADQWPDRDCIIWRDRRFTWAEVTDRTRRLASFLAGRGLGCHATLADLEGWQSPQDHLAIYLHNGNEYLESMLGAYKARVAPFNVNYRYVAEELRYVLVDAGTKAIVVHSRFTPTLADVIDDVPELELILQVDDGSGIELMDRAVWFEDALAAADPTLPQELVDSWSPDDQYVLYTGGTTGMPKGVLWRQADFLVAALGVGRKDGSEYESLDELLEGTHKDGLRALPSPPFMHGAAQWNAISSWVVGGAVVMQSVVDRFDAADVLDTCERERATSLQMVGDAFAVPLVDALRAKPRDLSSLRFLLSGGAVLSASRKAELLELVPHARIVDVLGSSESGRQAVSTSTTDRQADTARFAIDPAAVILTEDLTGIVTPTDAGSVGWLGQRGRCPRGYLGDAAKTAATFPVIDGERFAVPGDRARYDDTGGIELLGRDSVTINSGGEKIFAEEVEQAVKEHPDVTDAVVVGRPSERWGNEVVAIVASRPGANAVSDESIIATAEQHIARYKLPKAIIRVEQVQRSPSGKADYRWAKAIAASDDPLTP